VTACSSDPEEAAPTTTATTARATATLPALTGGNGPFIGSATATVLPDGYVEEELALAGTATSYRPEGELTADGRWTLAELDTAEYRTRVLVRRPAKATDFSGTVVVEWLNVSGGIDASPAYSYLADEILRRGHAWVGVSAQHLGVEGGPVAVPTSRGEGIAGRGLRALDPARYGELRHPGDAFAYDIFTQAARMLRSGGVLGELTPERLLAVGESQSAFALTTYVNGVQPVAGEYDGFLIHSRAAAPLPLEGLDVNIAAALGGTPTIIRDDLDVPVLMLQTETDVLTFLRSIDARQPDTDVFRLWEVAGSAHADLFLLGDPASLGCTSPVNAGPTHFVALAALRHLDRWAAGGDPPPEADRLQVDGDAFVRDEDGNVVGGVRTPHVDVAVDTLSGEPPDGASIVCMLAGSTTPLPPERLAARYGSAEAYLAEFEAALDRAIEAGFLLAEDRAAIADDAAPERFG
jgi:hypothetical protein